MNYENRHEFYRLGTWQQRGYYVAKECLTFKESNQFELCYKAHGGNWSQARDELGIMWDNEPKFVQLLHELVPGASFTAEEWVGINSKPPNSPIHKWHHDYHGWKSPRAREPQPSRLVFFVYLNDTSPVNACLRVIAGSHLNWFPPIDEKMGLVTDADVTPVSVRIGDVVAVDARLLHGTYGNRTDKDRNMVLRWYQIGAEIPMEERLATREKARLNGNTKVTTC